MQHVGWTQLYLCGRHLMPSIALPLTAQYQKLRQKRWICSDTDIFVGKVCLLDVDCLSLFDEEVEYNNNNNNNHLTAVCPGQPGSASTRRNIHPLTPILINVLPLSPFSICNRLRHPLYSAYVLDSPLGQPLSRSSLVFPLVLNPQLHTPCISSPKHHHLFAAHAHTSAACSAAISMLCHLHLVSLSAPYLGVCLLA